MDASGGWGHVATRKAPSVLRQATVGHTGRLCVEGRALVVLLITNSQMLGGTEDGVPSLGAHGAVLILVLVHDQARRGEEGGGTTNNRCC